MSTCAHEWSEAYVCTLCDAVKYDSAPTWTTITKLTSAPRAVWLAMWACAKRHTHNPPPVYPGNAWLSEHTGGMAESTLQGHLRTLQRLGWIRRSSETRRSFFLAWQKPYPLESRTLTPGSHTPRISTATPQDPSVDPQDPTANPPGSHTLNLDDLGIELGSNLDDDAGARPDTPSLDKCGLCEVLTPVLGTWTRRVHRDCPTHRDFKPDNPAPEEHTHHGHRDIKPDNEEHAPGDSDAKGHPGAGDVAKSHRLSGRDGVPVGRQAGRPGFATVDGHRPAPSLADHAAAIRARPPDPSPGGQLVVTGKPRRRNGDPGARGDDSRGAGDHRGRGDGASAKAGPRAAARGGHADPTAPAASERLSQELVEAVAAAGDAWSVRLGEVRFEQDVRACVDDIGLTPEELTRALKAWDTWDRAERPNRREVLWGRAASRAWVRKAAGVGGEVVKFAPLSGGAVVDTTPYWAKPGFVPEAGVS